MVRAPAGAVRTVALTNKKSNLFAQLGELDELESGNEHLGDIADIIQELMRCPEKIKACKRVTLSPVWDPVLRARAQVCFGETVLQVSRIPKGWLKDHLPGLVKIEAGKLKIYEKDAKSSMHKILCRCAQLDMNSPLPTKVMADFKKQMALRINHWGKWDLPDRTASIDWGQYGWYKLLPPPKEGDDDEHVFDRVSFLGKREAKLPTFYRVTTKWTVHDNFAMKSAYLAPPAEEALKGKDMKYKLFNAFMKDAEFACLVLEDVDGSDSEDDDDDEASLTRSSAGAVAAAKSGASSSTKKIATTSAGAAGGEVESGDLPPKKKPKLSPAKLQAILASKDKGKGKTKIKKK